MESILPLIILFFIGGPLLLALWLIVRTIRAKDQLAEFSQRLDAVERELRNGQQKETPVPSPEPSPAPPAIPPIAPVPVPAGPEVSRPIFDPVPSSSIVSEPPRSRPASTPKPKPVIDWEQFMGVKMFAWLGGLAAFIGMALAIKYSFDHNLISPEIRMTGGGCIGLILIAVGLLVHRRKQYIVGAQTLCATGVVILYAVTYACHAIYKFPGFYPNPILAFSLMIGITAAALLLAIRLEALVVALLGILGGFLTPLLVNTGQDNPLGLFGYIAILDAGLLMVSLRQRWNFLALLGAVGTLFLQIGWVDKFFVSGEYFAGDKIFIALGCLLGFNALFFAFMAWAKRSRQLSPWQLAALLLLALGALGFAGWFLTFAPLAHRPLLIFGFVFLIDAGIAALAWVDEKMARLHSLAGLGAFALLWSWTRQWLTGGFLDTALLLYFTFAAFHSLLPVLLQRRAIIKKSSSINQLFPLLSLGLALWPVFQQASVSLIVWPFFLLVDALVIILAWVSLSLWLVPIALVLTLAALGECLFKVPANLAGLPEWLGLLGLFSVIFIAVGLGLTRKLKPAVFNGEIKSDNDMKAPENVASQIPVLSAVLPFSLLILSVLRLSTTTPTPFFVLALVLAVMLLVVSRLFLLDWLPMVGLACVVVLECTWQACRFAPETGMICLLWHVGFLGLFTAFPFLFFKRFSRKTIPWVTSALTALPQFFLIHHTIKQAWPNGMMGLLPAAFALLSLAGFTILRKRNDLNDNARLTQLAWFGGMTLLFITLIFPIQFEHQWITIGWVVEGAALLWLFHRIPHQGLRLVGAGLLVTAFVRLALNPAVFTYHARSTMPVFNWYLYTYGIAIACFFTAAWLLAPPRHQVAKLNLPPLLAALGTVLAFLLLNIEIADYFSEPGSILTFQFSGNTPRDMVYSIAWGLFALLLLVVGIGKKAPAARYAGVSLLSVTLLKLFLHDLSHLPQLCRIGAFVGVAVIALLASFAYQKFFALNDSTKASASPVEETKSTRDKGTHCA